VATGRSNQLTKQIGEYLVAAELGRLGLIAATFSGSVPDYDIIATDPTFRSVPVQVKAINGGSWQFNIRHFVDIRVEGTRQIVGYRVPLSNEIVCVMVVVSRYGTDRFYVLPLITLQDLLVEHYRVYLERHGGVRPKKFDSFHVGVTERDLVPFKDRWLAEFRDQRGLQVNGGESTPQTGPGLE
jgi:hypothetical protein